MHRTPTDRTKPSQVDYVWRKAKHGDGTFNSVVFAAVIVSLCLLTGAGLAVSAAISPEAQNASWQPVQQSLSWEPPPLDNPTTITIPADQRRRLAVNMDPNKDYIIQMPDTPLRAGLALVGGRNVVLIGGEISIPWQGDDASIGSRTMLLIRGATGTVHIEGLRGGGEDISEGIQIDAPDAVVQLQNIRIDNVHARDQQDFSDNHPDLIQTYGNVEELRIDGFTGSSDYQGIFLTANYNGPHGRVIARRMNISGAPTARYLWWVNPQSGAGTVLLEDIWIEVPDERNGGLGNAVWPNAIHSTSRQAQIIVDEQGRQVIVWPPGMEPVITGMIYGGAPPTGDFVPLESVGIGYRRSQIVADAGILPSPTPIGTGTRVADAGILATPTLTPSAIPTLPPAAHPSGDRSAARRADAGRSTARSAETRAARKPAAREQSGAASTGRGPATNHRPSCDRRLRVGGAGASLWRGPTGAERAGWAYDDSKRRPFTPVHGNTQW